MHGDKHPLQLFQSQTLPDLIDKASKEFDQVIIDTAPIIPVSDAILVAKYCQLKLFVVSTEKDTIRILRRAIGKASAHGIEMDGVILNHQRKDMTGESAYAYYADDKNSAETLIPV